MKVADIRSKNIRPKGIRLKDILPLSYLFSGEAIVSRDFISD
jgi:hypothetical protein